MSKTFTAEFKFETAKLILDQNYTYLEAAKAMNVSLLAISRCARALRLERQEKTPPGLPLTPEQIELRTMKKKIQRLERENDLFKRGYHALNVGLTEKFSVVDRLRARYPVKALCRIFNVHRSSYRYWCHPEKSDVERTVKRSLVNEAWNASGGSADAREYRHNSHQYPRCEAWPLVSG